MKHNEWSLENSKELESLNNEIQHYQDGFAKLYFSSIYVPNEADMLNSFVTFCLETQTAGARQNWFLKERPWQTMNHMIARKFLTNTYATDGIDDEQYREITSEQKQSIIDQYFAQFHCPVEEILFYSLSEWAPDQKSFHHKADFGSVFGSRGIVGVSKNRIGLFYIAGPNFWSGGPTIIKL